MIGKTVGQYRITARLGAGGMEEVFLAEDMRLDRTVRLWNVETRRELMQLDHGGVELGQMLSLAFSPEGRHLLAGWSRGAAFWSTLPIG